MQLDLESLADPSARHAASELVNDLDARTLYCLSTSRGVAKRAMDIAGALLFLASFGLHHVAITVAVRLYLGGSVHYWQHRIGQSSRKFPSINFGPRS